MIVSMFGGPRSGKTTTAARVFSNLKEAGFNSEFVPEQARLYIAEKRVKEGLQPKDKLYLKDEDQLEIMKKQLEYQQLMSKACGSGSVIVTDSSPLNALLYMSDFLRNSFEVLTLVDKCLLDSGSYFYCKPVPWLGGLDPNRIHNQEESLTIDNNIKNVIFPLLKAPPTMLIGDFDLRWKTATSRVMNDIIGRD